MKITDQIHQLRIDFEVQMGPGKVLPRFVNVIIVMGEKITLVDTGVKGSETVIANYLKEQGRSIEEIETVILSHSHPDHLGSAATLKELTGCKIVAHKGERHWMENVGLQERERPVPGFSNLLDRDVIVDELLTDGQLVKASEKTTIEVIYTPGHSDGLLSLYFQEDKVLFTGDAIPLKNDIPNYSNFGQLIDSLHKIKGDERYEVMLTSWTPAYRDRKEIISLIDEGEAYLEKIDKVVKVVYKGANDQSPECCKEAVTRLGLPLLFATPIVDSAFRSHFE